MGELMAGCIGGALSAWNTPFEVARIEATARIFNSGNSGGGGGGGGGGKSERLSLFSTLKLVVSWARARVSHGVSYG